MDFQDVYNYEIIEDIFQDKEVEDHVNTFSEWLVYDECEYDPRFKRDDEMLSDESDIFFPPSKVEKQIEEPLVSILEPKIYKEKQWRNEI